MKNMFWLLDIKEIFGNNKYIVYIHPDHVDPVGELDEESINWEEELDKRFLEVANKKVQKEHLILKKVQEFDKNSTILINSIYSAQLLTHKKMLNYETKVNDVIDKLQRNQFI